MSITIIAAIGNNNELGKNNALLWSLPDDLKNFKEQTTGNTIIMGRKTFESIGRALPNRNNIVVTRNADFNYDGVTVAHSLDEALQLAQKNNNEIFIIGGGELYKAALSFADKLEITKVHGDFDADVFFPYIDTSIWREVARTHHGTDEKHNYEFDFVTYKKYEKDN